METVVLTDTARLHKTQLEMAALSDWGATNIANTKLRMIVSDHERI